MPLIDEEPVFSAYVLEAEDGQINVTLNQEEEITELTSGEIRLILWNG